MSKTTFEKLGIPYEERDGIFYPVIVAGTEKADIDAGKYGRMPWMAKPYFYSSDIRGLHRAKLSPYQKRFYAKLYRLRIVEQKRFEVGGAKYTEDLKRFHQLQDEYLLLVNNDIKSVVELVDFIGEQKEKIHQIEDRQHEFF